MKQVEIRFKSQGWSATHGPFAAGDLLRCSDEEARHFVDDAQAAEYVAAKGAASEPAPAPAPTPAPAPAKPSPAAKKITKGQQP